MNPISLPKTTTPASKHPHVLVWLVPLAFVLVYFAARMALERVAAGSSAALGIALLPVPFFAALVIGYARLMRGLDELERRIQLEALAIAFPCALLVTFTAGVLEFAGFPGKGNWDLPRLWPLILLPYWAGVALAQRKYR